MLGYDEAKKSIVVEQRGRFKKGDVLEILSPDDNYCKTIEVGNVRDEDGNLIEDCKFVQQKLYVESDIKLNRYDILRKRNA